MLKHRPGNFDQACIGGIVAAKSYLPGSAAQNPDLAVKLETQTLDAAGPLVRVEKGDQVFDVEPDSHAVRTNFVNDSPACTTLRRKQ
jgi:hypothetical protein